MSNTNVIVSISLRF